MAITVQELLQAGAHFGHQTHRWNPKMRPYIYGARNGIYILNLEKTKNAWQAARDTIVRTIEHGKRVLFVGTKPQAQEVVREEAERSHQFHVNRRWLGGMLTNYNTIRLRVKRMREIDDIKTSDKPGHHSKKDLIKLTKELQKLEKSLLGIKDMSDLPGLVVVVDPKKEHIAIKEARKLHIPIIAITDTNCDPEGIDYVIPSNDDALKAIRLFLHDAAEACLEGNRRFEERIQEETRQRLKAEAEAKKAQATTPPALSNQAAKDGIKTEVTVAASTSMASTSTPSDDTKATNVAPTTIAGE